MFTLSKNKEGKPVSFSAIEDQRIKLFSEHMSPHGVIFGGRILDIVAEYAKVVAEKHAETRCDTKGIDFVRFYAQAKRGDILICKASVNRAWDTTLEIGVKVIAEDFRTLEKKHILSAYFTYEAFDESGNSQEISFLICETFDQKRRYIDAQKRRGKNRKFQSISLSDN